ncbi:MAG: dethiobiotin synthase [Rhodospirillales bacterium RIFCSPLOWO2_12_FULL_58_28]|nr:MAG: dethiobiotin synthase [Rhodospirillales bacterium RIFCSPLOWO2_02_FULL_58_16]OHC78498.1 MAG: dethiobiotin synthase [Rhodospirillales bacterium RIFCSPLOWO2_12_FULL_58_28]
MTGGLFVAGTDTSVGKTVVAACLVKAMDGDYWKPVQSGLGDDADTATVARLTGLSGDRLHPPAYEFTNPLSPHQAALLEGVAIDMERFQLPRTSRPLVVEGAGGLLVPLNDTHTMIDLIIRLGLPVALVTRSGLGAINHTLLSLEALNARAVSVIGVIVNGPSNPGNVEAIRHYGRVRVIFEMPELVPLDGAAVKRAAESLSGIPG